MKFNHIWKRARSAALAMAFLVGGGSLAAQGVVTGRVTDAATKQPLQQAQVNIVGTTQRVLTNQDGQYRLTNVPAGTALVRVIFIGYKSESRSVFVTAGGSVTADFALTAAAVGLEAIVVTPAGNETVRQEGNHMPTVQLSTVTQSQQISNLSDAIDARVPGVVVQQSGGTVGSGTRIRIRGSNSVSLSNDPVLVVDGVRVDNNSSSSTIGVGGQVPSRLNDFNPDDIESIQVSEGPSAGVLYGTDAANGAIIMQTKKGHPGPTVWNVNFQGGLQNDIGNYPANYRGVTGTGTSCRLTQMAAGACTIANVITLNPIEQFSPFRTGNLTNMGISASGGNEQTTYYVAGHYNYENGVYSVNTNKQVFLRANLHHQAASNLTFDVSSGYVTSALRLPQNDNNLFGVLSSGFLGGTDSTVNQGYAFLTPQQSFAIHTFQLIDHFTGSFNAKYTPRSWLEINATLGNDFISRRDENTTPPGVITLQQNSFIGNRAANPFQIYTYTANFFATAEFLLTPTISSRTSAGLQYFRSDLHGVTGSVLGLTAGSGSLAGGVVPTVSEQTTETATFGKFAEERIGIRDRLFFTGSLRSDQNSSFGRSFGNILYPKIAASWVISEEPFFPSLGWLNTLHLRAAYGKSGLHPNALDALQYFTATPVVVASADVPGVTVGGLGNPNLKPESDGEIEAGFDADVWNSRINLAVTGYSKKSTDALIAVTEPPSCGSCSATQFRNLGEITNKGIEIEASGNVFRSDNVDVSLSVGVWGNRNRVVTLGPGIAPIIFGLGGFSQRIEPGYAAGAYFMVPYTYADANGDGLISTSEVKLGTKAVFLGNPFPDHGITIRPDITVMQRWHVAALFDGRYGNKLFNSTEQFRCGFANCQARNDPKASLADQAAAVANILPGGTQAGYIEDGAFMKLREVSLTFDAPDQWAHRLGASALSISVSGRNLKTWTNYRGLDPELNEAGQSNFITADFLTQPPVRTWVTRINLTF